MIVIDQDDSIVYSDELVGFVDVIARWSPFSEDTVRFRVPEGDSLADILRVGTFHAGTEYRVFVDEHGPIPPDWWARIRPRAGHQVTIRAWPHRGGGGSKGWIGIVLGVILIIVGAVMSYYTAGSGTSFILMGVSMILGGIVNMLIPPPSVGRLGKTTGTSDKPSPSLTGASNTARPYEPVARPYGSYRVWPSYGALPYTEAFGNKQYLRLLFVVGYGPLDMSDFKIGDTPVSNFAEVEMEVRPGYPNDAPLTLYTNDVFEEPLSLSLAVQTDPVTNVKSEPEPIRRTHDAVDEWSVDFVFLFGLFGIDGAGHTVPLSSRIRVWYRKAGTTPWLVASDKSYSAKSFFPIRRSVRFVATERAVYEIKVRQTNGGVGGGVGTNTNAAVWSSLRSVIYRDPITMPGLAKIAMRIRATDQLNGVLDTFSCQVQSRLRSWDSASQTWKDNVVTNNPADVYRDILQGSANARPVADRRLDLTALQAWHEVNTREGFTFNGVFDTRQTVFDSLREVAACGRASFHMKDGKFSIVREQPQSVPIQHFTPRNSSNFRGTKVFLDFPHALKVQFINPDAHYQRDERLVYDDGYDVTNASKFETLETFGITDPNIAYRMGRYYLAAARLRPEVFEFDTDFENLVCSRGDLIRVTHDVPSFGLGYGRVKTVALDGQGRAVSITIDDAFIMTDDGSTTNPGAAALYGNVVQGQGPVAYWRLGDRSEQTGTVAVDASGQNLHGTYLGSVTRGVPGLPVGSTNLAVTFPGTTTDKVTGHNDPHLNPGTGSMTWAILFRMTSSADGTLFQRLTASVGGIVIRINHVGTGRLDALVHNIVAISTPAGPVYNDGVAHALVVVLDRTVHRLSLFVDGVVITTVDASILLGVNLTSTDVGEIGRNVAGTLDEMAIYPRALTAAEIAVQASAFRGEIGQYVLRIRTASGASVLAPIVRVIGTQTLLTFTAPLDAPLPGPGDLVMFGQLGAESQDMLVKQIQPLPDLGARLACVGADPGVYTADVGPIPPFQSNISTGPGFIEDIPPAPIVDAVIADERALLQSADGGWQVRILVLVHFISRPSVPAQYVDIRWRPTDQGDDGVYTQSAVPVSGDAVEISAMPVNQGDTYDLRLRSVGPNGATSVWVDIFGVLVVGLSTPPIDVTYFVREGDLLRWHYDTPPRDFAGFRLRRHFGSNLDWATAQPLHDTLLTGLTFSVPLDDHQIVTYLLKSVDVGGNESVNAAHVITDLGDLLPANLIRTVDSNALGWPGVRENGTVTGGDLVATDSGLFWSPDDLQLFWAALDSTTFWPAVRYNELGYTALVTLSGTEVPSDLLVDISATAMSYSLEYRLADSAPFWAVSGATLFWNASAGATFWPAGETVPFLPWLGTLRGVTGPAYEFRFRGAAGLVQAVLHEFNILVDFPDLIERFPNLAIAITTGTRLPLTKTFRSIQLVNLTLNTDGGSAVTARVEDKNEVTGPLIKCYSSGGSVVAGHVDAVAIGY